MHESLVRLYAPENAGLHQHVAQRLLPETDAIAGQFYVDLLDNPATRRFLDNDTVERHLKPAFSHWLADLFQVHDQASAQALAERQVQIGEIHARIEVPMHLVASAMRMLKQACFSRLIEDQLDTTALTAAIIHVSELLDASLALVNQSYLGQVLESERNAQRLRSQVIGHELRLECERQRSAMFDWLRNILAQVSSGHMPCRSILPDAFHADFGLWITHKAGLYFADFKESEAILDELRQVDESVKAIDAAMTGVGEALPQAITRLNETINRLSWQFNNIIERLEQEHENTDPLTRLLNRRYLPAVMQRENRMSMNNGEPYAVLMIDVDHFKRINDIHGHAIGDKVLQHVGQRIGRTVRGTDFAFRYGGEEFLVLMSAIGAENALQRAEALRAEIADVRFDVGNAREPMAVTVSVGVAVFAGHPDYNRVIDAADRALYEAKASGRNRVVVAAPA